MNKSAVYIALLFSLIGLLFFLASYFMGSKEIVFTHNGLQYERIEKSEVVESNRHHPALFIITDSLAQTKHLYKTNTEEGYESSWFVYETKNIEIPNEELLTFSITDKLEYHEIIYLEQSERIALLASASEIDAMRLIQYTVEPGFFGFLDDSAFIFLLIAIIAFFIIWFVEAIGNLLQHFVHPSARLVWQLLCIVGALMFFSLVNIVSWMPNSSNALLIRNVILMLGTYGVFQYVNKRFVPNLGFADGEAVKFITLFGSLVILLYVGNAIGKVYDSYLYEAILPKSFRSGMHLAFGLSTAFVLGNLLNNLRKRWLYLRANHRLLKRAKIESLASKAELESLQASINPHFLYNALNSIAALAPHDAVKTEKMALALSDFYRYVTDTHTVPTSTLADELELVQRYLEVEQIRFGERLEVELDCEAATLGHHLARFTLQPLVENAIKHGFQEGKIHVKIASHLQNNALILKIFDKGKAFDEDMTMGYGLQSVNKKLRLLFPERHKLEFVNTPEKYILIQAWN